MIYRLKILDELERLNTELYGPIGIHVEQLKQEMLFFKKLLHGFLPCSRGGGEGEKKMMILQLINHWETVITSGVFWIIIQVLSDRNNPENYNSSFL